MKKNIYILNGAIHSGKTTTLMNWCAGRGDVSGVLTPVINGKRVFMDIESKELFSMEADDKEENILSIGKYKFSNASFDKASQIIKNSLKKKQGWLVIDEIGPLELKGEGFCDVLKTVLSTRSDLNIVLMSRDSIVEDLINYFKIDRKKIHLLNIGFFSPAK